MKFLSQNDHLWNMTRWDLIKKQDIQDNDFSSQLEKKVESGDKGEKEEGTRWIEKQYAEEFQLVSLLVQETQYIFP